MGKYRDAGATIKQLKEEVANLQSQLMQTEISYQTKINILKQNQQKFMPVVGKNEEVFEMVAGKDKVIEDLHKMVSNLKVGKSDLERQVRELSTAYSSKVDTSANETTLNPKLMDGYVSKLENEVKFLKM
jgi:predicted RNase H-like nuclease (RuvC/YqgF family)